MDVVALREEYGEDLHLIGNIDKRVLATNKGAIKGEVERKFALTEEGGYIPSVDHTVSSDIPFENYVYYNKLYKSYLKRRR